MFITAVYVWCLYVISACIIRSSSSLSFFQGLNEGVQEIIIRLLWSLEEYESLQYAPSNQGRQKKRKTETCSFMHHFSWSGDLVFPRLPWSLRVRAVIWLVRRTFGMNHVFCYWTMGCQGAFYLISVFLLSMAYISSSFHGVLHTPSNLEQLSMLRKIDDILPKTFHSLYRTTCNLILYAF